MRGEVNEMSKGRKLALIALAIVGVICTMVGAVMIWGNNMGLETWACFGVAIFGGLYMIWVV